MRGRPSPAVRHPLTSPFNLNYRPATFDADPAATLLDDAAGRMRPRGGSDVTIATLRFGAPGTIGEIAPHQVEVRARREGNHYRYRIVDGLGGTYRSFHSVSSLPLTFGELVEVIGESEAIPDPAWTEFEEEEESGILLPVLANVFGFLGGRNWRGESAGDRSALVDAVRAFVQTESELYPELERYVQSEIDDWLERRGGLQRAERENGARGRKWEPAASPVPAESRVAGAHDAAIERLVRAWWRDHSAPSSVDGGLDLVSRSILLRSSIRAHACRFGKLPAGLFHIEGGSEDGLVDIDELTESGMLIERVLREGSIVAPPSPGWPEAMLANVSIREFGGRFYFLHAQGINGPLGTLPDLSEQADFEAFCEEFVERYGTLVAMSDGYAPMRVYSMLGAYVTTDENGFHGPYVDFETAARQQSIYRIFDTTTQIWDVDHGVVFEGGILYRPEVVERLGSVDASGVIRRSPGDRGS